MTGLLLGLSIVAVGAMAAGGALTGGLLGTLCAVLIPLPSPQAYRALEHRIHALTGAEGELRGELSATREQARIAEALARSAEDAASHASQVRSAFLTRMSHELRTPLNAVIGYSEMVEEELESSELRQDVVRIRRAGLHLKGLVTTVLDLTQLESGRYEVHPERVDLAKMIAEIVEGASNELESQKNELEVDVPSDAIATVDPRMMNSILFNLVHNAIKYTNGGTVRIQVKITEEVFLRVQDTGIGMTPRQLREAFQPFVQGDGSTTRRYDGSGLGLAICKGFAEAMSGRIEVESQPGKGATVDVYLPREVHAASPFQEYSEDFEQPTVLLR